MKVLIIGQWIYPLITPRANRTWELAKGFAKFGADVTVYALLGDRDYTNEEKKYNIKVRNLGDSQRGLVDSQGKSRRTFFNRAMGRIVGEYNAYPGYELYSMIKKCFKSETGVDLLITIAHPHVIHWAASKYIDILKPNCWIADCGDPFMGNAFYTPHKRFSKYEKLWCDKVNYITIPIDDAKCGYYPEYLGKLQIIPQGFDNSEIELVDYRSCIVPTFAFAGQVYDGIRDPRRFLEYLVEQDVNCKFIAYSESQVFSEFASRLGNRLEIRIKVHRNELISHLSGCDFLINISNGTSIQTPSKLIDYAVSGRPILTISSLFDEKDQQNFNAFLKADYAAETKVSQVEKYSIVRVVNQFIDLYHQHIYSSQYKNSVLL